jgi:hypothetical protein
MATARLPSRPSPDCVSDYAVGHVPRCPVFLVLLFFLREAVDGNGSSATASRLRSGLQKYLKKKTFSDF